MTYPDEMAAVFDFVTHNAAKALRLESYGLEPGCQADLNILAAPTGACAAPAASAPRVIRSARVLARNTLERQLSDNQIESRRRTR